MLPADLCCIRYAVRRSMQIKRRRAGICPLTVGPGRHRNRAVSALAGTAPDVSQSLGLAGGWIGCLLIEPR